MSDTDRQSILQLQRERDRWKRRAVALKDAIIGLLIGARSPGTPKATAKLLLEQVNRAIRQINEGAGR